MPDFQPLIDALPASSLAVLVAFGMVLYFAFRWLERSNILVARREIKEGKGDGLPVAFIDAMREVSETNREVIQTNRDTLAVKREELSAIRDMGAIIAASNRIAVEQQAGAGKVLETLLAIEKSCIEHVAVQKQTATETRALSDKIDDLAREMARRGR